VVVPVAVTVTVVVPVRVPVPVAGFALRLLHFGRILGSGRVIVIVVVIMRPTVVVHMIEIPPAHGGHGNSVGPRLHSPRADQTRSIMVAMPIPPPMHSVMRAVALPSLSSSSSAVPMRIAPVAPSG